MEPIVLLKVFISGLSTNIAQKVVYEAAFLKAEKVNEESLAEPNLIVVAELNGSAFLKLTLFIDVSLFKQLTELFVFHFFGDYGIISSNFRKMCVRRVQYL